MQLFIFNYPVKLMPSTCTRLPPLYPNSTSFPAFPAHPHMSFVCGMNQLSVKSLFFRPLLLLATNSTADGGLALKYWLLA